MATAVFTILDMSKNMFFTTKIGNFKAILSHKLKIKHEARDIFSLGKMQWTQFWKLMFKSVIVKC
jgi:hypothetical protein